jgi:glutaredoxin
MKLMLYGTRYCHLCEQAEALLEAAGLTAKYVDIASDNALLEKYRIRIPVLVRDDNSAELGWPFDAPALQRFIAQTN